MKYRVEKKFLVTDADIAVIAGKLSPLMSLDAHQKGKSYELRSLYFDDIWDTGLEEKDAGVNHREKFRIRIYDGSTDVIHLEMKGKCHGYTSKESCSLSLQEAEGFIDGTQPVTLDGRSTFNRFQLMRHTRLMRPRVIIKYDRTAFVHPSGNVRITFDRNISAGRACGELFSDTLPGMVPLLPKGTHIMEVKYDEFLPDFIKMNLETGRLRTTAFSKYYLGRLALNGQIFRES